MVPTLVYPEYAHLTPTGFQVFIELDGFLDDFVQLGLDDEDLHKLQIALMCGGQHAIELPGTGGLREIRFAPRRGVNEIKFVAHDDQEDYFNLRFVLFEEFSVVLLVTVYDGDAVELSPDEAEEISALIERERVAFADRHRTSRSPNGSSIAP